MLRKSLSSAAEVLAVSVLVALPVVLMIIFFYGLFTLLFPAPACG